ncbi:hypothetical protein [Bacillus thuringiensis]|nr:hypothetical protein [Bacillus thuringiensis]
MVPLETGLKVIDTEVFPLIDITAYRDLTASIPDRFQLIGL